MAENALSHYNQADQANEKVSPSIPLNCGFVAFKLPGKLLNVRIRQ